MSTAPYKRTYKHSKSRGSEYRIRCDLCGRLVPRYKTFVVYKGFNLLNDPILRKQIDPKRFHTFKRKLRLCPKCARFLGVAQPGKSVRKKHLKLKK
ncbi:MAG: hypothetical protein B6U78_01655 [Candidatus Aenigmarchaeota archaeon ex4484_224]|nr:MAG: hypothetical protein B6U78_01655 [Candidatus Aenigmarchaeota archaeon ex4484_224]